MNTERPLRAFAVSMRADAPNEPEQLLVEALESKTAESPYITITASYAATRTDGVWPAGLTFDAAMRIAAICEALGMQMDGLGVLTPVAAAIGMDLSWIQKPESDGE